jgi:hypothetical protein
VLVAVYLRVGHRHRAAQSAAWRKNDVGAVTVASPPERMAEADVSAYVLAALDEHLAVLSRIRDGMRVGGTVSPGTRRALALDGVAHATRFADAVGRALGAAADPACACGRPVAPPSRTGRP